MKGITALLFLVSVGGCYGNLNVYLSQWEVRRLLGLSAELYYVREGVVNQYALNFVVPVPAHISDLHFTWQSLSSKPLPYVMSVTVSDRSALSPPKVNVSLVGSVPTKPQTFQVALPCSGLADAEVEVTITINVTTHRNHNTTSLVFRRRKICLKDHAVLNAAPSDQTSRAPRPVPEGHGPGVSVDTAPPELELSDTDGDGALYAALGCACALLVILALLASACCARNRQKARRQDGLHESRLVANSQLSGPLLHSATYMLPSAPAPNNYHVSATAPGSSSAKSAASSYASFSSRRQQLPPARHDSAHSVLAPSTFPASSTCTRDERTHDLHVRITELTIQRCRVRLRSVLQEGTFGRVYLGSYADANTSIEEEVLVKTVADHASQIQVSLLLQEGMTMYALNHPNILTVRGVSIEDHTAPFLIYPYKDYTNLKRFLMKCRICAEGVSLALTTQQLVDMALQVTSGLQYLHRKQILHRDLAARNCVVDSNLKIQISDNALSRDLFSADYHCLGDNENRPVKWLALEALTYHNFSMASDVWAFGVLLWELATLAQQPYAEVDPFEMADYLKDGYRLAQPVNCPDELFAVMAYCWSTSPEERPSMQQLHTCLQGFYNQLTRYV